MGRRTACRLVFAPDRNTPCSVLFPALIERHALMPQVGNAIASWLLLTLMAEPTVEHLA